MADISVIQLGVVTINKYTQMELELARLPNYDDTSMLAEIRRVAALIPSDAALTVQEFNKHSKAHSSTIRHRFGSWKKALTLAGLADRYSGQPVSDKMRTQIARNMSERELIEELRRVAHDISSITLTVEQFNANSNLSASVMRRRFGSWNKVLKRAGLQPTNMGRRYNEDDYFENLLAVWTHLGRQPKYGEMNAHPSTISSGAYEKRWGTWTKALLAFIDRMNSDTPPTPPTPIPEQGREVKPSNPMQMQEDTRKIPLGLRYEVLKKDNFKCTKCGRSPALTLGLELHVDHKQPFSKEGKTTIGNLQTLCKECNLGKGNR